jgi:hypothetical protein
MERFSNRCVDKYRDAITPGFSAVQCKGSKKQWQNSSISAHINECDLDVKAQLTPNYPCSEYFEEKKITASAGTFAAGIFCAAWSKAASIASLKLSPNAIPRDITVSVSCDLCENPGFRVIQHAILVAAYRHSGGWLNRFVQFFCDVPHLPKIIAVVTIWRLRSLATALDSISFAWMPEDIVVRGKSFALKWSKQGLRARFAQTIAAACYKRWFLKERKCSRTTELTKKCEKYQNNWNFHFGKIHWPATTRAGQWGHDFKKKLKKLKIFQ